MQRQITSKWFTLCTITGIWLFTSAIAIAVKVPHPNIMAPVPVSYFDSFVMRNNSRDTMMQYWCWIHGYFVWRIFGEYFWMWVALAVSLVIYIPLYFWMRGTLVIHNPQWWRVTLRSPQLLNNFQMAVRRRAFIMAA